MQRWLPVFIAFMVAIVAMGACTTWNSVGLIEGWIQSPRFGEEFSGKKDVIEVPVSIKSNNGETAYAEILFKDQIVWSETLEPNGLKVAKIIDPQTLFELNKKGYVDMKVTATIRQRAQVMDIMGTGLHKESGIVVATSPPVSFRVIRDDAMIITVVGNDEKITVSTPSKKIGIYSDFSPGYFGMSVSYRKMEEFSTSQPVRFEIPKISGQQLAVVDGVGSTAIIRFDSAFSIVQTKDQTLSPKTTEASPVTFKGKGIVAYAFDIIELLTSIVLMIVFSIAVRIFVWIWGK